MPVDLKYVDEAVERYGREPEAVIPILQSLQDHYGYLPEEGLHRVCESTHIAPSRVTGVSSFYDMFRLKPVGKHIVRVCRGTACHVTGADRVEDALRRHLSIPAGKDTDAHGHFTVEQVACLGCCTLAPVVRIGDQTFGHTAAEKTPGMVRDFLTRHSTQSARASTEESLDPSHDRPQIRIGLGSCCMAKGSDDIFHQLRQTVRQTGA